MITEAERNRRLDANGKALRRLIEYNGKLALLNFVRSGNKAKYTVICEHLRFLADVYVDVNGDVISEKQKYDYYLAVGILDEKEAADMVPL